MPLLPPESPLSLHPTFFKFLFARSYWIIIIVIIIIIIVIKKAFI